VTRRGDIARDRGGMTRRGDIARDRGDIAGGGGEAAP
jgi:hypothetical protein